MTYDLVLNWQIAYSGSDPRQVGWSLREEGWPGFIQRYVEPALRWTEDMHVAILLHHPWGQIGDPMYITGYDEARAVRARWLVNGFATAAGWKSVTSRVDCYGYVGGLAATPSLAGQSTADRCALTVRNLRPFVDAGFKGVYIDAAENAISVPFRGINAVQSALPSCDVLTLAIADDMFERPAGIEAAPRAFAEFAHLFDRNCVLQDSVWQHRYGPNRHANWRALGYDQSVLEGQIWRTLPYRDRPEDLAVQVQEIAAIVADAHVPAISPQPYIAAGLSAWELVHG